ncbi:hypothetical protein [Bacillus velezensis]|uniref:hypothetical protein n=1 Tax=Bacillus velezensis TaxID=492670 RepID=UPI003EB7054A
MDKKIALQYLEAVASTLQPIEIIRFVFMVDQYSSKLNYGLEKEDLITYTRKILDMSDSEIEHMWIATGGDIMDVYDAYKEIKSGE